MMNNEILTYSGVNEYPVKFVVSKRWRWLTLRDFRRQKFINRPLQQKIYRSVIIKSGVYQVLHDSVNIPGGDDN